MNRTATMTVALAAVVLLAAARPAQPATDPHAALRAIVDNARGTSMRATLTLTVQRPGQETVYTLAVVSDGAMRSLVQVRAPARDAGQAFLIDGDNLWIYSPRLKRALRLPPSGRSESFLGSDIAYNDLGGRDFEEDYTPRVLAEDGATITLELMPRPQAPTPYGRVTIRAAIPTHAPAEAAFYDQRGQVVKRILFAEHVRTGTKLFPTRITIEDVLRPGNRTVAAYSAYQFGVTVPPGCFTLRALESGC